jgi:hypothetical protein
MQRREHQTEFAKDEVNESYDADVQQPRATSQLHGPNRPKMSNFAPDNKAGQRFDSCERCLKAFCSVIISPLSSQFLIDIHSVFLKLGLTPDSRNVERAQDCPPDRTNQPFFGYLIWWRRARTFRETSKKVFYGHLSQPKRINDPALRHSFKSEQS